MRREAFRFDYEVYTATADLGEPDRQLLQAAGKAAGNAYAPYSHFLVGAAARLENGETVTGSNQENASFPAGLCAEGVAMATAASLFPGIAIEAIAITCHPPDGSASDPISPCGICRQAMQEYRLRSGRPIRLIMSGAEEKIIVLDDASSLLPFAFKF